ncbi:hypothetical protein K9L97_00860 [Candidatus Woesearchaeota archaeon]|nr:hypothetical protein [Candidatus Woesearchaeota archaeon]
MKQNKKLNIIMIIIITILIIATGLNNYEKYTLQNIPKIECEQTNQINNSTPYIQTFTQYVCENYKITQTLFTNKKTAKLASQKTIQEQENVKIKKCHKDKTIYKYEEENPYLIILEKEGSRNEIQTKILVQDYSLTTLIETTNQKTINQYSKC